MSSLNKHVKRLMFGIAIVIAFFLTGITGYGLTSLFKFLGADHMTISGVIGCYFFPLVIYAILVVLLIIYIDDKL